MSLFDKVFYGDYAIDVFHKLFHEVSLLIDADKPYEMYLNACLNAVIIAFLQDDILYNLSELFANHNIADSATKEEIWLLYKHMLEANNNTIIDSSIPEYFAGINIDADGKLIVDHERVILDYSKYFIATRRTLFIEATNMYSGIHHQICEQLVRAFEAIYATIKLDASASNIRINTYAIATNVAKQQDCNDVVNYNLIIDLMYDLGFHSNKFREAYKHWSRNMSISIIRFQELYLLKLIPNDHRNRTINRKYIHNLVDEYEAQINKIEAKIKSDDDKLRQLYESDITDENIVELINECS